MKTEILSFIQKNKSDGKKLLAVLVDPDDGEQVVVNVAKKCSKLGADIVLVGGSLLSNYQTTEAVKWVKSFFDGPVVLFPGNEMQACEGADALFFLMLLSGRNPEYLVGKHVASAPFLAKSGLEIIPVSYLLIDSGKLTSVNYISHTLPIPADKPDIAAATALAGQFMGHKIVYMDAGSGALNSVSTNMVGAVKSAVQLPVIVGGGIKDAETAKALYHAGADVLVIGNGIAQNIELMEGLTEIRRL